jgi:hypothetical protein
MIENAIKKYFVKRYERELYMIKCDFAYERTVKVARTTADEEILRVDKTNCVLEDGTKITIWFVKDCDKIYYDWMEVK